MRPILSIAILFLVTPTFAQQAPIAIVSANGTTKLTSTLDSAAILAQDNDIIYLPGGTLAGQTIKNFDKKVTVIGVGHNPDSTAATGRTFINGNIGFYNGAQGSVLDGVYVSDNAYFTANCKFYRVNASSILGYTDHTMENVVISQCVARVHLVSGTNQFGFAGGMSNTKISNCIIGSVPGSNFTAGHTNTTYENCIFLIQGAYGIDVASLSTFKNCIFTGITSWGNASNSNFYNNAFIGIGYPPLTDSSNAIGNLVNLTLANTFVTAPVAPSSTYNYACDYLINSSSPALAGGTGGTQIGIYGGSSPWVKGNIPPNPHIRSKNVDATTGSGGTLRVRFNVGVQ
jgi:hypothetical protein